MAREEERGWRPRLTDLVRRWKGRAIHRQGASDAFAHTEAGSAAVVTATDGMCGVVAAGVLGVHLSGGGVRPAALLAREGLRERPGLLHGASSWGSLSRT